MIINATHNLKNVSYYSIVFNGSSNIEPIGYKGITHIIEHCMCEKVKEIESELKHVSITWNAFTTDNKMAFYISGLSQFVKKFQDKFTDAILNYKIEKEVFERERTIIITEYYQTFSNQISSYINNFNRKHFNSCGPIGYIDDLKNLTYEKFIEYKNNYFSNPSYIGFIHSKSQKDLKDLNIKFNNRKEFYIPCKFGIYNDYKFENCAEFKNQRIVHLFSLLTDNDNYRYFVAMKYFIDIISSGLTSPLYQELREKLGCVYQLIGYENQFNENLFTVEFIVLSDNEKYGIVLNRFKNVIKNIKSYITKEMFDTTVESIIYQNKLSKNLEFQKTEVFNQGYERIMQIYMNKEITYDEFLQYVDNFLNSNYSFHVDLDYI